MDFFDSININLGKEPVLKWAGGKQKILSTIIPKYINRGMIDNGQVYFEPFLGGGSVAFYFNFNKMVLGDKNERLINFYQIVKEDYEKLYQKLNQHISVFIRSKKENKEKFYYDIRNRFNNAAKRKDKNEKINQAAFFWFLNKTGFNGLYRESKSGKFNSPFGKRDCPSPEIKDFQYISSILKNCELIYGDFEETCRNAKSGDLVYLDPPYIPVSNTSSFDSYLKGGFDISEQFRLRNFMNELSSKGIRIVMSNSNSEKTKNIYGDLPNFKTEEIDVRRLISAKTIGRGMIKEVVITNIIN